MGTMRARNGSLCNEKLPGACKVSISSDVCGTVTCILSQSISNFNRNARALIWSRQPQVAGTGKKGMHGSIERLLENLSTIFNLTHIATQISTM